MKSWQFIKLSILAAFVFCSNAEGSVETLDEFQKRAAIALTSEVQISTYDSVLKIFKPVMLEQTCNIFQSYFKILFSKDFPKAPHPQSKMLEFFRCLYASLAETNSFEDQKAELDKRLFFHKAAIAKLDQNLADQIQGFPCENCEKSAKQQIMGRKPSDMCLE